jgi:hypothetical protein
MAGTAAIVPSFAQEKKTEECTDLKKVELNQDLTSEDEVEDDVLQGIVIEVIAEPEGGLENFYHRLKEALDKNRFMASKGKVYVALDIDSTGMITKYQVVRGIDSKTNSIVVNTIKRLNFKFTPARQRNRAVKSRLIVPVVL